MSRKEKIIAAAGKFLERLSNHRNEAELRRELDELCKAFEPGTTNLEYRTAEGPADLYLPNQRAFFEVKKRKGRTLDPDKPQPGNNESPKEQGLRYLRAERERERGTLPLDDESRSERPWSLVVTDGYNWHGWQAGHDEDAETKIGEVILKGGGGGTIPEHRQRRQASTRLPRAGPLPGACGTPLDSHKPPRCFARGLPGAQKAR